MTIIFKKFNFLCKLVAGCPLWLYSSIFSVTSQTKRNLRFSVSRSSLIPRPNEEICWWLSNSKPCTKCFCNCRAVALKKQFPSVFMGLPWDHILRDFLSCYLRAVWSSLILCCSKLIPVQKGWLTVRFFTIEGQSNPLFCFYILLSNS